ncbi:MAG: Ubiquitin-conjugating enzyme E2 4, partial [Alyxoria varia]
MGRITHSSPREPAADYFVNQIRRQRTSSSLLLQVIQCRPDLQAQGTADALHQHVNKEIEANPDLMAKLARIQLPSDAAKRRALGEIPSEEHETAASDAENITSVKAAQPREVAGSDAPEVDPGIQPRYHIILTMRGLSDQVNDQSANAVASTSTSRAHSWSALSGISLAETSILTSTILPLSEPELNKFRKLVAPVNRSEFELRLDDAPKSMFARSNQYSRGHLSYGSAGQTSRRVSHLSEDFMKHYGLRGTSAGPPNPGSLRRINKELNDMNHDPPSSCAAGPTGDDLYNWEGTIMGPGDTPYSGGVFFVSIRLPGEYPFHPPHIIFKTRVYHPNIDSRGRISADILGGSWCTTWTIAK